VRPPCCLHLEPVALARCLAQADGLEQLVAPGLETAGQVAIGQEQHRAREQGAALTDQAPVERPADCASAGHPARAEDEVRVTHERNDEAGQVRRIVAEVGVHLDDGHGPRLVEDPLEPVAIRDPQALLGPAVEDLDLRVRRGEGVRHLPGAVGRIVVNDQDVSFGKGREHRGDDLGQILPLVEGGDHDPHPAPGGQAD
jgi:hypothetical protein